MTEREYLAKGMVSLQNGRPDIATAYSLMVIATLMLDRQQGPYRPEPV